MAPYIEEFIAYKQDLGYNYREEERILATLDKFLLENNILSVGMSKEAVDQWTQKHNGESELSRYGRMVCLIQFSSYLRDLGILSYIPSLPKYPGSTFIPHIYSIEEMTALFKASDRLRLKNKNMSSSIFIMPCLLRLLYGTGIRINEALRLKNKDVNLTDNFLLLEDTKNGKDRIIPFTDSLADVCQDYLNQKDKLPIGDLGKAENPFFVSLNGLPCLHGSVYSWYRKILAEAGIPFNGDRKGPRIHDIRHSFACHSFVKMADDGIDLYCSWPYLSAYLGHQDLESTEKYIRLTVQLYPDLLENADRVYLDVLPNISNIK